MVQIPVLALKKIYDFFYASKFVILIALKNSSNWTLPLKIHIIHLQGFYCYIFFGQLMSYTKLGGF